MTPQQPATAPVGDQVPKVNEEVAVGENLDFQRRWWRFERAVWAFFLVLIICDLLGLFGHGWLSKARASVPDGSLQVEYERIERANTPSALTLHFGPGAIRDGQVQVYVSDTLIQHLGAARIAPQPASSTIGAAGVTYRFPATAAPATVRFSLEPPAPGRHLFRVQIPGRPAVERHVVVLP